MPSGWIIRKPGTKEEWEEVKQMLIAYESEFDDKMCFTSFEAELKDIEQLYRDPDKSKLIALNDKGEIGGCVALRSFDPGHAEMKRLYVKKEFRGMHLGKILGDAIVAEAKRMGYKSMLLDTMNAMKAAQGLYHQMGFVETSPYNGQDPARVICYKLSL